MALPTSGDITASDLNTEFDGLETDLQGVVDAWATPDYAINFHAAAHAGTDVIHYFRAPDDAKVLAMRAHSYESSTITGTWTATLAAADADDLLNQGVAVSESVTYSSASGAQQPTPTDYSGTTAPLWLRKGAIYKITISRDSGSDTLDWFAVCLALRLYPRRV